MPACKLLHQAHHVRVGSCGPGGETLLKVDMFSWNLKSMYVQEDRSKH